MPGVTEEQIIAARRMTAIEFLRRYRPGELVKTDSRGEFELREHDSFKINEETSFWHWKSRDIGGKSALDYLVKVEGIKFVDAVLALCEENPSYIPPPSQPEQEKEFALPPAAANNRRVFAYLLKRGISRKVIEACVRAGILYESADYHNAVFVGKDETGTARNAFLRGTYTKGKPFKAEVSGSDKRFCLRKEGIAMTKQRLVKMTGGDQNILVKALRSAQESAGPELSGGMQALIEKTVNAPRCRLYLSDEEFEKAALSLNGMRNAYLAENRSCGGIDRLLIKLTQAKYRYAPAR